MDKGLPILLAERRIPALWFHTVEQAYSKSRLGGLPSLPEGVGWPVHPDTELPLHFLAQIDLGALPDTPLPDCRHNAALPREGMLYFFFNYAAYWDEPFSDLDSSGVPKQSRVIYTPAAGPDHPPPANLPLISYLPDTMDSVRIEKERLIPAQNLRAYVIDTFMDAIDKFEAGRPVLPLFDIAHEAKFQSIVKATGEAAPVFPSYEALPNLRPSYYSFVGNTGLRNMFQGLQMFGAEFWDGGSAPKESKALLAEFMLDGHDFPFHFWIKRQDLAAHRFKGVYAEAMSS
jgi:hypothetical protein